MIKSQLISKKKCIFLSIVAIIGTFFMISAMSYQSSNKPVIIPVESNCLFNTVIFDLGDVIFATDKSLYRQFVFSTLKKYPSTIFSLFTLINIKEVLFDILRSIPAKADHVIYNHGKPMPAILTDWMVNSQSTQEIITQALAAIQQTDHATGIKVMLSEIVQMMFSPTSMIQTQIMMDEMAHLAKDLKAAGYQIYVLSNWSLDASAVLKEKYKEFFAIFDGVMISGEEQLAKPNPEFFLRLLQKYSIDPSKTVFIDDEPNNNKTAQSLGLFAITHQDAASTFQALIPCNIIQATTK